MYRAQDGVATRQESVTGMRTMTLEVPKFYLPKLASATLLLPQLEDFSKSIPTSLNPI